MPKHSIENQAEQAVQKAQQHLLQTDDELLETLQTRLGKLNHEKRQVRAWSIIIGTILAGLMCVGSWQQSTWGFVPLFLLVVFTALLIVLHRANRDIHAQLQMAIQALTHQDYNDQQLKRALNAWQGDLSPLSSQKIHYVDSISEKAAAHPVLGPLWAQWLLGKKPIRSLDFEIFRDALDAERHLQEWQQERAKGETDQAEFRQHALELLPAELVNQVRAEQLTKRLPDAAPQSTSRERF